MSIHKTAVIDKTAKIGKDVQIDPYAVIGPDVSIGERTRIMSHAVVHYSEMGTDNIVYPHTSLGLEPQHIGYKGEKTKLVIGNRCVFRENVTVHRGTLFDKGVTKVGDDGYFMNYSHIAHDCQIGNKVIMANGAQLAGHVEVGNNVFISTLLGVHQYVRIGDGAFVSGGAMVPMDVAPFCLAQGDRAYLKGLNLVGMKRSGIKRESIKLIKEAYRLVFLSGKTLKEGLSDPLFNSSDPNVQIFKNFLEASRRGFIRPNERLKDKEVEMV